MLTFKQVEALFWIVELGSFEAAASKLNASQSAISKRIQELESTFGHYATIRRHTTGILQAADISVVRTSTISLATEQMMLAAPRYWLAPGLVALAAWLADNRTLAERALAESAAELGRLSARRQDRPAYPLRR